MDFIAKANILIAASGSMYTMIGIVTNQPLPKLFGIMHGLISLGLSAWILIEKLA